MKLGYTIVFVKDVVQTIELWEQAFGLRRRMLSEHGEYGELDTGATTLGFVALDYIRSELPTEFAAQGKEAAPAFEVALTTDDVAKAQERALQAGATMVVKPTVKPWGQTVAYVRDRNGILVEICTPMS